MSRSSIKVLVLIALLVPLGLVSAFFLFDVFTSKQVTSSEKAQLYNEEKSIDFSLTREKFLFGLFGDVKNKEIYITKEDGSTEIISVGKDNVFFETGNEWAIQKEITKNIKKNGEIWTEAVTSYTIMGTEEKIIDLAQDFTKTFQVEAKIN